MTENIFGIIKKGGIRPDSLFGAARLRVPSSAGIKGPLGPVGRNHPGWRDARNLRPLGRRGCQNRHPILICPACGPRYFNRFGQVDGSWAILEKVKK